jgi:hypothetical protein
MPTGREEGVVEKGAEAMALGLYRGSQLYGAKAASLYDESAVIMCGGGRPVMKSEAIVVEVYEGKLKQWSR